MLFRLFILTYFCLNFIDHSTGKLVINDPSVFPHYLKAGDNLDLLCQQFEGFKISWSRKVSWLKEYEVLSNSVDTGFVTLAHRNGVYNLRLTKKNVQVTDSGSYKCSSENSRDSPYAVDVIIIEIERVSRGVVQAGNSSTLYCSLRHPSFKPSVLWHKDGFEVGRTESPVNPPPPTSSSPPPSYKFSLSTTYTLQSTDSLLSIKNIGENEVGEYKCEFVLNDVQSFNQSIFLYSYPQIKGLPPSHNVVEGSRMEVRCVAWGWPVPQVVWSRDPTHLNLNQTHQLKENKRLQMINDSMVIDDVDLFDRDKYYCTATTIFNGTFSLSDQASILIRVRGKWAALVPLFGILLEFVLLCAIIFLYERKKKRMRGERAAKEALEIKQSQTPKQCMSSRTTSVKSRKSSNR